MSNYWKVGALVLGASLVFAAPTFAEENEGEEAAATETERDRNQMQCKRVHVTGTRIPQRVCLSRGEWDDMRAEAEETLSQANQDSNTVHSNE